MHFNTFGCIWDWPAGFFLRPSTIPCLGMSRVLAEPQKREFSAVEKKGTMPFLTVEMAIFCYICCNSVIKCDHMLSLDICNSLLNPAADLHMDLFCRPTKRGVHLARFSETFLVSSIALISPPAPHACFGDWAAPQHPSDFKTTSGQSSGQKVGINMNNIRYHKIS